MTTDILIVSAEPSGDALGARLITSLEGQSPDLALSIIGGPDLERPGLTSLMNVSGLAILGYVEGLKAYPLVLKKVSEAVSLILEVKPRAVVLIDSWGLMVRIAKGLKKRGYSGTIIKYVAPQVWATRPGRAKILARFIDHLLSTQPMDRPYFDAVGLPQTFVGNPVFDTDYQAGNAETLREKLGLNDSQPVIGLFPGSRPSEIDRIAPAIIDADQRLQALTGGHQSVCLVANDVGDGVKALLAGTDIVPVQQSDLLDLLALIDGAIACSGTITSQLAAAGVPSVVLYRVSHITYTIGRRLMQPDHISLVNIAAETTLMPEFLQDEIDSDKPARALFDLIKDETGREALSQALIQQTRHMGAGQGGASDRAAQAILSLIN